MAELTPTVPLQADNAYKAAFKSYASKRQVPMAKLVRDALDALYGDDIKRHLDFNAQSDQLLIHSDSAVSS